MSETGTAKASPLELLVGTREGRTSLARGTGSWSFLVAGLALIAGLSVHLPGFHARTIVLVSVAAMGASAALAVWGSAVRPDILQGMITLSYPVFVLTIGLAGARVGEAAAVIPGLVSTAWIWFPPRWAFAVFAVTAATYGLVLARTPHETYPGLRWMFVVGVAAATSAVLGWLMFKVRRLAEAERLATSELHAAHIELTNWNLELERRVAEQVAKIDALGHLRRFLSPQIAEAVLNSAESGDDRLLLPHRRQIAVLFCDLRGFTSFTSNAEPEDVVEVLGEYYASIGELVEEFGATVGHFAGDGIMIYFNDPLPSPDPAGAAVRLALRLRKPMLSRIPEWQRRGFDLGYGVGIAFGYATLGTIGFEGRWDYTPLGSVVNLASRLCDAAAPGEILLDNKTHDQTCEWLNAEPITLKLKGYSEDVIAFRVGQQRLQGSG